MIHHPIPYYLNSRSVNFYWLTDTWFFREFPWRNFDVRFSSRARKQSSAQAGSRHKEIKTFPLFIWRNSRLSRPKAYVPCALVRRVVGAWMWTFGGKKYAGRSWIWNFKFRHLFVVTGTEKNWLALTPSLDETLN